MGLETATDGHVFSTTGDRGHAHRKPRRRHVSSIQMVFQNPFDTLNPSMTVGRQIIRALEVFGIGENDEASASERMLELLDLVKLPRAFADRMPRQLSGGQKQRVGIARAFAGGRADRGRGRARLGARRVGAGRRHRPSDGDPAQQKTTLLFISTTFRSCATSRTGSW
jgi:hypothetical protein